MAELFNRFGRLTVTSPGADYFGEGTNAIQVTDLRLTFKIEKHLGKEPNTASVEIYNLNADTRARLQNKPLRVRLEAGYQDQVEQLFVGDLLWGPSKRVSPDWVTSLQIGDGLRAYRHARVSRSYRSGVSVKTVLGTLAKSMGLSIPSSASGAKDFVKKMSGGSVLHGPSRKQLSAVLARSGHGWSIQDSKLQILKGSERSSLAFVISTETGMVGVPEFGAPRKKGESPVLTLRTLLRPQITPGAALTLRSSTANGLFRIENVVHSGDTHGPDWYTDIEARPIK